MSKAVTISSAPPARISMDYSALRESGMEVIRRWAGESWTDHNVHDPGITILEACAYAMTELGLRLQLDVSDLMRSSESNRVPDLEPAHRVLPAGPVTPRDLRRVLLDHPLVRDAQIFLPADNEVPFYEAANADPPLTYSAGTPRIRPGGLYEVLVELRTDPSRPQLDPNSNTYSLTVRSAAQDYDIDLALPFWDEDEAAPFREGATVTTVAMVAEGGDVWRALPEPHSFFGRLDVAFTGPSGAGHVVTWVLIRITSPVPPPAAVPGILAAARTAVESTAATAPVLQFVARVRRAVAAVHQLESYIAGWRNLGEQAVRIGVARVQEIAVQARIEVTGGIDTAQLVAEVFADLDQMFSPRVRFESLSSRRRTEADSGGIYDGPLLRNGFLASGAVAHPDVFYLSDILRVIMQRRGGARADVVAQENPAGRDIVAVTDLALTNFINNRPITSGAENCLHLVDVDRFRPRLSLAKSRIVLVRNESEVRPDPVRVRALFDALVAQAEAGSRTADTSPVWPVPRGDLLPIEEYTPLQDDLPALYGVGRAVLPESAGPTRHALARQLQGYLLLFEQVLADTTAQLGNVNRFFSGDADEGTTYFTKPLFDVEGVPALLKRLSTGGDRNAVARALHDAAEDEARVLDRRNRMLDHLLARQGEDTVALGQEVHRWAQIQLELAALALTGEEQLTRIKKRRNAANARLLRIKAALLDAAPELNAFRLLAHSHPLSGDATLLRIDSTAAGFRWRLTLGGQERLRSAGTSTTSTAASIDAENALSFAARRSLYVDVDAGGGQRRLEVRDGTTTAAQAVAESSQTFGTVAAAKQAADDIAEAFRQLRIGSSLAPLERRIAFLTGIRSQRRRRLLTKTDDHFEVVNDPPPGSFGKRWRLHELPGNAGQVLLTSPSRFTASTDQQAIDLAQASIRQVLRHGIDEWNYVIVETGPGAFTYELKDPKDPAGPSIAVSAALSTSRAEAERALVATVDHLYRTYSGEGFFLIEHLLVRPRVRTPQIAEPLLSLPAGDDPTKRQRDPYSQRVSFVFPSGGVRDFSLPNAPATPAVPERFRDPEFRRHAERVIQQACPAHLLPAVYWVDRQAPGTPDRPASFDAWEQRYSAWLDSVLIPGAPAAAVDAARADMIASLKAIADDAL